MAGVRVTGMMSMEDTKEKNEYKREARNKIISNWKNKEMYGQFSREMPDNTDGQKAWEWTKKSNLKVETETLIFAAQE